MVTMHWTKDGQGKLVLAWKPEDEAAGGEKPVRTYHKAVQPTYKTRRQARRRLLRTLSLAVVVS